MRLTKLEIENFKSIGKRQSIDIRPITLLFGPNSVGKSTVLQALYYLYQVLDGNMYLSDKSKVGNIDLGGFSSIVHRQDLDKAIKLKATVKLDDNARDERYPLNTSSSLMQEVPFNDLEIDLLPINYILGNELSAGKLNEVSVGVEISWWGQIPCVRRLEIDMNGEPLFAVVTPSGIADSIGPAEITEINFGHHLLKRMEESVLADIESNRPAEPSNVVPVDMRKKSWTNPAEKLRKWEQESKTKYSEYFDKQNDRSPLEQEIREVFKIDEEISNVTVRCNQLKFSFLNLHALPDLSDCGSSQGHFHIDQRRVRENEAHRKMLPGTIPLPLLQEAVTSLPWDRISENSSTLERRHEQLRRIIKELCVNPVEMLRDYLVETMYIGPMREIPVRNYVSNSNRSHKYWNSLDVWNSICNERDWSGEHYQEVVNDWLTNKFNTSYQIELKTFKEVSRGEGSSQLIEFDAKEGGSEGPSGLGDFPTRYGFKLKDQEQGILIDAVDVGFGISQLIPVVAAALSEHVGLVAIEQPELHLHPAHQVVMGDLFSYGRDAWSAGKVFMIETHSEHIILRLLRRIRETTENELPLDVKELSPNDLSIMYVDKTDEGVRFCKLRVDETGEFKDRWPRGFFEERAEELF